MERKVKLLERKVVLLQSFSPLAGIRFVESLQLRLTNPVELENCFSPLAGIRFVESFYFE